MVYIVNRKYYYSSLNGAIEKAKEILQERAFSPINEIFQITQGKRGGYCVTLCDDWTKVGNDKLLKVVIQTEKLLD